MKLISEEKIDTNFKIGDLVKVTYADFNGAIGRIIPHQRDNEISFCHTVKLLKNKHGHIIKKTKILVIHPNWLKLA